jgi:D-arabinose 5-phosphate isomerase GutQ
MTLGRIRKAILILSILLSIFAAVAVTKSAFMDESDLAKFATGVLVGPTPQEAIQTNPGVQAAITRARAAKISLMLVLVAATLQVAAIFLDRPR